MDNSFLNESYPAKTAYQSEDEARHYEARRFRGLIGSAINSSELRAVRACLERIRPVKRVLDVAAGTGRIACMIAPLTRVLVTIDISLAMLSRSTSGIPVLGDAGHLPFRDQTFDLVTCIRLFHHLPAPVRRRVLMEMTRVTRRYLIVAYYHRRFLAPLTAVLNRALGQRPGRFLVSQGEFNDDLYACSLRLVKSSSIGPQFSGIVHLLEKV